MKLIGKLFVLFTAVTSVELYLLLKIAEYTNWWITLLTILVPGMVGAWLARREGVRALAGVRGALVSGREPARPLVEGALVLLAGAFLLTPGVLTDLTGLALLVPPVRRRVADRIAARAHRAISARIASGAVRVFAGGPLGRSNGPARDPGGQPVIDAEDIPPRSGR